MEEKPESEDLKSEQIGDSEFKGPATISYIEVFRVVFSRKTAPHAILLLLFLIILGFFSFLLTDNKTNPNH